jgi:hypothetical protein
MNAMVCWDAYVGRSLSILHFVLRMIPNFGVAGDTSISTLPKSVSSDMVDEVQVILPFRTTDRSCLLSLSIRAVFSSSFKIDTFNTR